MWAATTLSCRLWPPATTTGSQGTFIVSARYSRPRKNINYDYDDEEDEEKEQIDSWKQQEMVDSDDASVEEQQAKISGSVVLLALQKASAQKTSKQRTKKKKKKEVDDKRLRQGDASTDYSAVKPLCVKSDWKDRLEELETQLHQLIHNA